MIRSQSEAERLHQFGQILRGARRAIPVDAASVGKMARHPARVGKPVSQEEIAEAVGVSRVWYALLESGRATRASIRLLERLCEALMLDENQSLRLLQLGIPEISLLRFQPLLAGA